jgi:hypothetical protein
LPNVSKLVQLRQNRISQRGRISVGW